MAKQELIKWINSGIEKGMEPEKLKKSLMEAGYSPDRIQKAFKKAGVKMEGESVDEPKTKIGKKKFPLVGVIAGVVVVALIVAFALNAELFIPNDEKNEPELVPPSLEEAIVVFQAGDYGAAEEMLKEYIETDPSSSTAHYYLGVIHFENEEYEAAKERFNMALARSNTDPYPYYGLGYTELYLGDVDAAEQAFLAAQPLAPENAHSDFGLAAVALEKGNTEEAQTFFNQALARSTEARTQSALESWPGLAELA